MAYLPAKAAKLRTFLRPHHSSAIPRRPSALALLIGSPTASSPPPATGKVCPVSFVHWWAGGSLVPYGTSADADATALRACHPLAEAVGLTGQRGRRICLASEALSPIGSAKGMARKHPAHGRTLAAGVNAFACLVIKCISHLNASRTTPRVSAASQVAVRQSLTR